MGEAQTLAMSKRAPGVDASPASNRQDQKARLGVAKPRVAIIILNLNSYEVTRECLLSLRSIDYENFEILLVDNGSRDGSGEKLAADFPEVKLIRSDGNLGFPGGNNLAIRESLAGSADYLLLLNNDTVVAPDFLSHLVNVAESNPAIGIVDPKILYFEPGDRIWYAGGDYRPGRGLATTRGVHQRDSKKYDTTEEVSFATGCAFLIKTNVVRQIGLLDEVFFLGFEDLDWCIRARAAGFMIYYAPAARVWHKDSYDTKKNWGKPVKDFYSTRNRILLARKYLQIQHWPLFVVSLAGYIVYRSGGYVLRREPKRIAGLLRGVWAGISSPLHSAPANLRR
jgi:GT2 family glycosyltransferase